MAVDNFDLNQLILRVRSEKAAKIDATAVNDVSEDPRPKPEQKPEQKLKHISELTPKEQMHMLLFGKLEDLDISLVIGAQAIIDRNRYINRNLVNPA